MSQTPPFIVRTAGFVNRDRYHSTPGTRGNDIMLMVFLDGRGVYQNSTGRRPVGADTAALVPPEDPGVLMADLKDPYVHYYCRFHGDYAKQLSLEIIEARGDRFFPAINAEEIADCIRRMGFHSRHEKPPERMGRREVLLADALVKLCPGTVPEGPPPLSATALTEYLRNSIATPTELAKIAEHFHVSKSTLCRTVRSRTGSTVLKLHEEMKIDWAKTLLETRALTVSEVALRVGYEDALYFSRVFKKRTGYSPRNWLARRRKNKKLR